MKGINVYNSIPINLTMVLYHCHSVYSVCFATAVKSSTFCMIILAACQIVIIINYTFTIDEYLRDETKQLSHSYEHFKIANFFHYLFFLSLASADGIFSRQFGQ